MSDLGIHGQTVRTDGLPFSFREETALTSGRPVEARVPGASLACACMRGRWRGLARAIALGSALVGTVVAAATPAADAESTVDRPTPDAFDRLIAALQRFRGIGDPSVMRYCVELRLPDEEEETPPLLELWKAPDVLALRAAKPTTPRAVARSLALYLEPLYLARSSFLRTDLGEASAIVRSVAAIRAESSDAGETVFVEFPTPADERLPATLREVRLLSARLDGQGRLAALNVDLREAGVDGGSGELGLICTYAGDSRDPQPGYVRWTLPDGRPVEIRTGFRDEGGRRVPAERHLVFPSRYDPGEVEEILVEYGAYDLDSPIDEALLREPGTFRFGESGLVEE